MQRAHRFRGCIAVVFLLGAAVSCGLSGKPISVTVSEIGTCADYDKTTKEPIGITDEYPADTEQLMVYFYTKTNLEANVTYRWFLGEETIAEFEVPLDEGYNYGWIVRRPNEEWPEGEYRVEILLAGTLLRETTFRVSD
jgi:hypothetical protein